MQMENSLFFIHRSVFHTLFIIHLHHHDSFVCDGFELFGGLWTGGKRSGSPTCWLTAAQLLVRRMAFSIRRDFLWKNNIFLNPNCCSYSSSRFFASAVVNLMRRLVDGSGLRREIAAGSEAYSDQISSGGAGGRLINTFWFNSNFYPEKI